jgi:DNA-binding transcriptional ArsR family regulator
MVEYSSPALDAVFGAMSDPIRRAILVRLSEADARVTEIAGDFPVSLNAVSKHIKMLERAELVTRTVQGRDHILSLNAGPMAEAAGWIEHYRGFWEDRLAALDKYVTTHRTTNRTKERGNATKGTPK